MSRSVFYGGEGSPGLAQAHDDARHHAQRQGAPWYIVRNYQGAYWASRSVWPHTKAIGRAYPDGRVILSFPS